MSASSERSKRCKNAVESLLSLAHRKGDPVDILRRLEQRFPGPAAMLDANPYELRSEGLSETEAQLLSLVPDLTRYAMRREFRSHTKLATLSAVSELARTLYIGISIEQFYVFCLDAAGKLIECRLLQSGTIDETPFYISHLLQAAVTSNAHSIVLCHNHPAGTMRPSNADISATLDALQALYPLQISILDHIIVCGDQVISLRELGYIAASVWHDQNPGNPLLLNWLDV